MQKFFGCETIDGEARFAFCHIYMWSSFFNLGKISPSLYTSIHTYVIGHYIPLSQDYDLASQTAHAVSVNFIRKWRSLHSESLTSTDFWETFSWQIYLLLEFLPEITWREIAEENNFFFFVHISILFSFIQHYDLAFSHRSAAGDII